MLFARPLITGLGFLALGCSGVLARPGPSPVEQHKHLSGRKSSASSSGCGLTPPISPGSDADAQLDNSRLYHVYIPDSYDPNTPAPVIVAYHGFGSNHSRMATSTRFHKPKFNTGQIVVYMQGSLNANSITTWYGAPGAKTHDDIGYTNSVLDALESSYCIDTSRIYAVGFSQGGGMVGRLACDSGTSTRFAAFAPSSGAFYNTEVNSEASCDPETVALQSCNPGRTDVPLIEFHGGSDPTIHWLGGFRRGSCLPTIPHWMSQFAETQGITASPNATKISGTDNGVLYKYGDEGRVRNVYAGDKEVHSWFSAERGTAGFEATQMILDFFAEYTLS